MPIKHWKTNRFPFSGEPPEGDSQPASCTIANGFQPWRLTQQGASGITPVTPTYTRDIGVTAYQRGGEYLIHQPSHKPHNNRAGKCSKLKVQGSD